jgi:hypothetical protein
MFPLIPLPIREAVPTGYFSPKRNSLLYKFPLIPLPIREAVPPAVKKDDRTGLEFPLIPLPIREAVL